MSPDRPECMSSKVHIKSLRNKTKTGSGQNSLRLIKLRKAETMNQDRHPISSKQGARVPSSPMLKVIEKNQT